MTQDIKALVQETIESYYEYVTKIQGGCAVIAQAFKQNDTQAGLEGIVNLSEGLTWLFETEKLLAEQSYKIDSPVAQVVPLFIKMNAAIEANAHEDLVALLEDELSPLFKNASEWKFEEIVS
ncbi:MAG: hypothetical protein ABS948_01100 [Solibacillus sp.]